MNCSQITELCFIRLMYIVKATIIIKCTKGTPPPPPPTITQPTLCVDFQTKCASPEHQTRICSKEKKFPYPIPKNRTSRQ